MIGQTDGACCVLCSNSAVRSRYPEMFSQLFDSSACPFFDVASRNQPGNGYRTAVGFTRTACAKVSRVYQEQVNNPGVPAVPDGAAGVAE